MDALAGYGSDSNSEEDDNGDGGGGSGGLSGLLGHYSEDDSDGDDDNNANNGTTNNQNNDANGNIKPEVSSSNINTGMECRKEVDRSEEVKTITGNIDEAGSGGHTKKRRRRWDNPNEDPIASANIDNVLPPPSLLDTSATTNNNNNNKEKTSSDHFQSSLLFQKDYTKELRQKLSQQLQIQSQNKDEIISKDKQQLTKKLEQLHIKFHRSNQSSSSGDGAANAPSSSSFAAHLKSQKEFGNPHLLKSIIEHYSLSPLGSSHVGNSFGKFEYVDRLVVAEERTRMAAANYNAGMGGGGSSTGGGGSTAATSGP
mmetsp:Transcript_15261/g.29062  ORF Transcript_15261/g.29062 Transcript_15261/m.29062 type:complete len:313 (-) Transcript_15261:729-1667(-)|eukprot:CAMPEP_0201661080 /NCGR_PEP_ID=MMETSP0494-20130426/3540_1 /ASSEMBLY_ACC=CAM_ASM_000839 /TAXON_ID=420259 /ORGANISM="Thalassiosira gravida, Strain GMp14c1" /LENGTH=312 /DNA_ID=CAMNT_0048139101 /DNA_START=271 /DNA_END=1209 /DNA_ORIENTATION=-